MDNRIVIEPSSKIREIARKSLAGNWKQMFVGLLIYFIMLTGISTILNSFFYSIRYIYLSSGQYVPIRITYAGNLYMFLVEGALTCGLAMFVLAFFRTRKIDYSLTFEGFSMYGKAFCLFLLYTVKVFLWSLLLVIPGIIAAFRYSQCFYLRVDHPEWTASQCINESKRLMNGNKGKFFCLQLSFIGWYILANIPGSLFAQSEVSGLAYSAIFLILSLPVVVVDLYLETANVAFYELVTGNLVVIDPQYSNQTLNENGFRSETATEKETAEAKEEHEGAEPQGDGSAEESSEKSGSQGDSENNKLY